MTRMSRRAALVGTGAALAMPALSCTRTIAEPGNAVAIGVNLAGAEFGDLLGQHGREYLYPEARHFAAYAEQGFSLVRLPFKWERLEPQLGVFDSAETARLQAAVAEGTTRGLTVVLDPHNYGKRRLRTDGWSREHLIGSSALPSSTFAQFWARLSALFAHEPSVHFGLMNEPTLASAEAWAHIAQEAVEAIRSAGARNRIYVPGTAYSGAHSWTRAGNEVLRRLHDPVGDMVIEAHQYLDSDSSGTHPEAVSSSIGSERLRAFQTWARQNKLRAFLGEFGAAGDERSIRALIDMLDEVAANPDVWTGVAAWAGGPRWPPDAMFNLEPARDGATRPQTDVLAAFARGQPPVPRYLGVTPALYLDCRRETLGASAAAQPALSDLDALCARDHFTLVLEINGKQLAAPQQLLRTGTGVLVETRAGHFQCNLAPHLAVAAANHSPEQHVRCALVVEGDGVHMCATGGPVRSSARSLPRSAAAQRAFEIAPGVRRIAAFATTFPAHNLAALVA